MIAKWRMKFSKEFMLTSLKPKMLLIFQTVVQVHIKTRKTYSICVNIVLNSELMLNGSFSNFPWKITLWQNRGLCYRLARLGRAISNQVLTPTATFNFCKDNMKRINFIYLSKDEVDATRRKVCKKIQQHKNYCRNKIISRIYFNNPKVELSFPVKTRIYAKTHNFGYDLSIPESLNLKCLEYVCCTYSKNL